MQHHINFQVLKARGEMYIERRVFLLLSPQFKLVEGDSFMLPVSTNCIQDVMQLEGKERSGVRGHLPSIEGSFHIWCKLNWTEDK